MLTTEKLEKLSEILKIMPLAEKAEINGQTLLAKIREKREINVEESSKIEAVLNNYGMYLV